MRIEHASSWGRRRQSQAFVFLVQRLVLRKDRLLSGWPEMPRGTSSEEPASTTDEKSVLGSTGLTDQVASRRPYPPSSPLGVVIEKPG
jgi:hypothetical protein